MRRKLELILRITPMSRNPFRCTPWHRKVRNVSIYTYILTHHPLQSQSQSQQPQQHHAPQTRLPNPLHLHLHLQPLILLLEQTHQVLFLFLGGADGPTSPTGPMAALPEDNAAARQARRCVYGVPGRGRGVAVCVLCACGELCGWFFFIFSIFFSSSSACVCFVLWVWIGDGWVVGRMDVCCVMGGEEGGDWSRGYNCEERGEKEGRKEGRKEGGPYVPHPHPRIQIPIHIPHPTS